MRSRFRRLPLRRLARHRRLVLAALLGLTVSLALWPADRTRTQPPSPTPAPPWDVELAEGELVMPVTLHSGAAQWLQAGTVVLLFPAGSPFEVDEGTLEGDRSPLGPVTVVGPVTQENDLASGNLSTVLVVVQADEAARLADSAAGGSLWPAFMP